MRYLTNVHLYRCISKKNHLGKTFFGWTSYIYNFTVLFSVLVLSEQSAVPDMSRAVTNCIGHFTIVCIHHRLDWLGTMVGAIVINSYCKPMNILCLLAFTQFIFPGTSYSKALSGQRHSSGCAPSYYVTILVLTLV